MLNNLELWGGCFYTDGLVEVLQIIGNQVAFFKHVQISFGLSKRLFQLMSVSFVHLEEVDERAFAIISAW